MSHFTVLVIGPDVEAQLAPYHEFECTGINDRYVQDVDVTAEVREQMTGHQPATLEEVLDSYGLTDKIVDDESKVQTGAGQGYVEDRAARPPHMWGYAIVREGELVKAVDRTNPNNKWDWWVIGGRWSGFFKLKPGAPGLVGPRSLMGGCANSGPGFADQVVRGDVDFEGMRQAAGDKAGRRWDIARSAIAASGLEPTWRTWEQVRDQDHAGNIEAARQAYNDQPAKASAAQALDHPWDGVDEYLQPREAIVQAARDRAVAPFALVMNGEWIAKGEMGWFGVSDDKVTQDDWNHKVNELLDGLPDDTLLTLVDCHI